MEFVYVGHRGTVSGKKVALAPSAYFGGQATRLLAGQTGVVPWWFGTN